MSTTVTNLDAAKRLKPELILQVLGGVKAPETEMLQNVFKKKKNVNGSTVSREIVTRTIKAIPFVGQKNPGVILNGKTILAEGITTPPMKAHARIEASDFMKAKELRDKDYRAWLADELAYVKDTIAWNREWFARHFLTTGNCDYAFLVDGLFQALTYSLGTMTAVAGAPGTLFDAATARLTDVIKHLDLMYKTGQDVPNRNHFQNKDAVITYARTNVWNAIFDIIDGKLSSSSVPGRRLNQDDLEVGSWIVRKFDARTVDPETQAEGFAIPVKRMRMIDTGQASPHTMANLEIENLKATGGQKHVFILPLIDPGGEYVDIMVQHRPVGMFIPEAMVDSLAVIS